jgi:hypothetical protein
MTFDEKVARVKERATWHCMACGMEASGNTDWYDLDGGYTEGIPTHTCHEDIAAVRDLLLAVRGEVLNRLYATYHPLTTLSDPPELNVELMQRDPDWYWLTPRVADERCSEAVGAEIDRLLGPEKAGV